MALLVVLHSQLPLHRYSGEGLASQEQAPPVKQKIAGSHD
jgi:hypothetical protein